MTDQTGEPSALSELSKAFDRFFIPVVSDILAVESVPELAAPSLYSLKAGGKRIRPTLVLLCADLSPGFQPISDTTKEALYSAAAVECIHTYSLIHDDLPAMDNDDMRRGMPSCHRSYPEWAAILAGDTLNTLAFRLLVEAGGDARARVRILADAAGHAGMAAGQALDLSREKMDFPFSEGSQSYPLPHIADSALFEPLQTKREGQHLLAIHMRKTGALIQAACELGAACRQIDRLPFAAFGQGLGLLFQITDDILDIVGHPDQMGKTTGKDVRTGKLTFPAMLGIDGSRTLARDLSEVLQTRVQSLEVSSEARTTLGDLVRYVLDRDH